MKSFGFEQVRKRVSVAGSTRSDCKDDQSRNGESAHCQSDEEHLKILRRGVFSWNEWRGDNPEIIPNLKGADLSNLDLSNADFSGADLEDANFSRSNLQKVKFIGSWLGGTNLVGSSLEDATFQQALLDYADLSEADLTRS